MGGYWTVLQKERASKEDIASALQHAVSHINALPEEELHQWKRAIFYLYLLIYHRRPKEEHDELKAMVHQQIEESRYQKEGEEMSQTMAEYLVEQGEKRGEKRGELRTKRQAIVDLLRIRFASVPPSLTRKIYSMRNLSRMNALFEKAATAQTLDEIERALT